MKLSNYSVADFPVLSATNQKLLPKEVNFNDLQGVGAPRNSFGMSVGDTVEFPDSEADCKLMAIPVRENGPVQNVVLVTKNGKLAYFGLSNLRRRDADMKYVHPVGETLASTIRDQALADDDQTRLKLMFGKTITATESVKYQETVFEGNAPTNDRRERITAKIIFVEK